MMMRIGQFRSPVSLIIWLRRWCRPAWVKHEMDYPHFWDHDNNQLYHANGACLRPYRALLRGKKSPCLSFTPFGQEMWTFSSRSVFKKADFTSIWWKSNLLATACAMRAFKELSHPVGAKVFLQSFKKTWVKPWAQSQALYSTTFPTASFFFQNTHTVPTVIFLCAPPFPIVQVVPLPWFLFQLLPTNVPFPKNPQQPCSFWELHWLCWFLCALLGAWIMAENSTSKYLLPPE